MKLSRASSYAASAVAHMATRKQDGPVASHIVAKELGIPELFLLKVLKSLVSARILGSLKGPNGGYRLARPAKDISLLDIVEAVDGPIRGEVPPVGQDKSDGKLDKRLDAVCKETAELVRERFKKIKIANLAGK